MANSDDYIDYLVEQLSPLGSITARKMFGGHGIYCDGMMFGLIASDAFYIKVDAQTEPQFKAEGLDRFRYPKKEGGDIAMSYRESPSAALDDQDILLDWARLGVEAALRKPKKSKKKKA